MYETYTHKLYAREYILPFARSSFFFPQKHTKKMASTKKKRRKNTNDTNDEDETKKKRSKAITDAGELLVKMHAHGSFVRPLFVHRQTQKDIRERREALSAEFEGEEREEEEKGEAAAAAAAAATAAATVLVTGFPLEWHNEFSISDLFSSSFGETKRVQLIRLETNAAAKSALVTFERTKSVEKLWKKIEEKTIVEAPTILPRGSTKTDNNNSGKMNAPPQFGLDKFVYEHRLQRKGGAKAAKASIDEWFRDRAKAKEIEKRKRERENEDDGWTVVQQKRGRRKTSDNQGITVGAVRASTAERRRKEALRLEENDGDDDAGGFPDAGENNGSSFYRKKKKGTLGLAPVENFYKFQSRERRRNDLIALQRGFQADKAKVLAMKAARKFKPV